MRLERRRMAEALSVIQDLQEVGAVVELTLGRELGVYQSDGTPEVKENVLVLEKAPPAVFRALAERGFTFSLDWDGCVVCDI